MFFCKQKPAYEMRISEEFRRVLFRSYTAAPVAPSPAPPTSRSQSPLLLPLSSSNRSPFAAAVDPAACGAIDGGEGRVAPSVSDLFSVLAGQHDRTAAFLHAEAARRCWLVHGGQTGREGGREGGCQ